MLQYFSRLFTFVFRKLTPKSYPLGCEYRSRGLGHFNHILSQVGLPPLENQIEDKLRRQTSIKVLELGCGEGRLSLDLLNQFGDKVVLHGINRAPWAAMRGTQDLQRINRHSSIIPPERFKSLPLPRIHFFDAQDLSAFSEKDFDFIISQVVMEHIPRKDRVLEESSRLLVSGGTFIHQLDSKNFKGIDFADDDLPRFVIYQNSQKISATKFLQKCGIQILQTSDAPVLAAFTKSRQDLKLGLIFDAEASVKLSRLREQHPRHKSPLWGFRSVYRI